MNPGTQIAYIPRHVSREDTNFLSHPDVEFGFVTSEHQNGTHHFCRFWRKGNPGELRTTSSSELAPNENLIEHNSVDQAVVDGALNKIMADTMRSKTVHASKWKGERNGK